MRKINLSINIVMFIFTVLSSSMVAQEIVWWNNSETNNVKNFVAASSEYEVFDVNIEALKKELQKISLRGVNTGNSKIINFPDNNGEFHGFSVVRTEVMHPDLALKYPEVSSYVGVGVEDPTNVVRFSFYEKVGLNGSIIISGKGTKIIKSVSKSSIILYDAKSESKSSVFDCQIEEVTEKIIKKTSINTKNNNVGQLRRYRLALSVSGDYSQYFLDGSEVDDLERRSKVMIAMVNSMNRVNGLFERDFGVTMQIIPENDALVFLDPTTDPYDVGSDFNSILQRTIDNEPTIGASGYDVGHLFHKENSVYGNAGCIACVCTDGSKGSAFTVHSDPSSDNFNLIVAHEFGHQFGGYHVQSSSNCRSGFNSEVEPGSGSTIMGYAGICPTNVQNSPDDYFNYVDIRDVAIWTIQNSSCAEVIDTGNTAPVVDAGDDYIIPISTPFVLEGTATDIDNDTVLTYCWEQNNPEDTYSSSSPRSNWVAGPLFRSKLPSISNKRYMPALDDILVGNLTPTWEVLPSVSRTMRFELTVRDNALQSGQSNSDGITLSVDNSAGPFLVTSQTVSEKWIVGDQITIQWDVANTDQPPVNAAAVDIMLSVDGGYTYPYLLQNDIVNNGTATFVLPYVESTTNARIMVKASDNIFFAVNSTNFEIEESDFVIIPSNTNSSVCKLNDAVYTFDYRTFLSFSEEVTFTIENLPAGAQGQFNPTAINGSYLDFIPLELTITGTENFAEQEYSFVVKATSTSGIEKVVNLELEVFENVIDIPSLVSPSDTETSVSIMQSFEWLLDTNVDSYEIEIANDNSFLDIVTSAVVEENRYVSQDLLYNATYYWRVKSSNPCGSGNFSPMYSFSTACSNPENFEYTAVGASYVLLNWIDNNSSEWEIEYGLTGFQLGNGTKLLVNTNEYEVGGLNSVSSYDFYLRSICSIGGTSVWNGPITVATTEDFCNGDHFYDSGGLNGSYSNNELETTVISPGNVSDRVKVNFISFALESCCDELTIYDGPDASSPLIGSYRNVSPGTITSTHDSGSLTFVFRSDGSITYSGWDSEVICEPKPNCDAPDTITVDTISDASATLCWDTDSAISSWDIEYGPVGFQLGTGVIVNSTDATYVLDQLDPITNYEVYIKGICTAGGFSEVSDSITFQTLCTIFEAPFLESFTTSNTPECWLESDGNSWRYDLGASNDASQAGDRNVTGNTRYAWVDGSYPSGDDQISVLTTPFVDVSSLTTPSIQFSVFSKNTFDNTYNELVVDFYDGSDWNVVLELQENTNIWRDVVIDLSNYIITGAIQLRFTVTENSVGSSEHNDILIDEIKVDEMPSCLNPYLLEVSDIKGRSADVSWIAVGDEANWELQYGVQGFTPANAINEFATENSYKITGLLPTTTYQVYIRALCNIGDNSEFVGPITFTTGCDEFDAPFTEGFLNYNTPYCWQEEQDYNSWSYDTFYDQNTDTYIPDRTLGSNTQYTWINDHYNGTETLSYLSTPFINVSGLTTPSIQFSLNSGEVNNGDYNTLTVEFYDGTDWNTLLTFAEATQGWRDYYFDLSSYTITDAIKVRFGISENSNSYPFRYILIDEVTIGEMPNCLTPNSLSLDTITSDSVSLSWEVSGAETVWELEYGTPGFVPGTGTIVAADSSDDYLLTGLDAITSYELYLRADCGAGEYSNYINPVLFTTVCDSYIAPYVQDFQDYSTPACWQETGSESWLFNRNADYDATNANDHTVGGNTNYAWIDGSSPNGSSQVSSLYTPLIDVSVLNDPSLKFAVFSVNTDDNTYNTLLIEFYDGINWNTVIELQENTGGWREYNIDLSVYNITGNIQVRFTIAENSSGSPYYNDILLDDIIIDELYNCSEPVNITISDIGTNEATINIVPDTNETMWEIEYGYQGFVPGDMGTIIRTDVDGYVLTSLEEGTSYDVYVKTVCDTGGFSNRVGPYSFTSESVLGIEEQQFENALKLFPNPNKGSFTLSYTGGSALQEIQIFDYLGKLVYKEDLSQFNTQKNIDINSTESGVYIARVISNQSTVNKIFVVE